MESVTDCERRLLGTTSGDVSRTMRRFKRARVAFVGVCIGAACIMLGTMSGLRTGSVSWLEIQKTAGFLIVLLFAMRIQVAATRNAYAGTSAILKLFELLRCPKCAAQLTPGRCPRCGTPTPCEVMLPTIQPMGRSGQTDPAPSTATGREPAR